MTEQSERLTEAQREIKLLRVVKANKNVHMVSGTRAGNLMKRGWLVWDHHPDRYGWYLTDAGRVALKSSGGE